MRYDDASNTGSMAADSAPTARPDVEFLPQGDMGPATGNTITGAGTQSGASGADIVGDAPARIVEVTGASGPAAASGNGFQANGQYGVLNMDAEGNFSYVRNGGTPDGVQDIFGYTLADRDGSTSATTLTVNIGRDLTLEALGTAQGVVNLPPGVELSDIRVSGRDLIIQMPDGTQMVIPGGAVFVPQLTIGDVEVPATNLAALLVNSEPQPAAGLVPSSGGNFDVPVPPLDPGVPLGDLIPPTELDFTPPEFEEPGQFLDRDPEIIIEPVDGAPAVNALSDVDEAGLPVRNGPEPEGTGEEAAAGDNGDASETTTGVINITSPDGIDGVTINGVLVTGTVGQTIAGDFGTLTITGFLADGDIQYSYTLADNTIGDATHDDFEVTITDNDGDTATGTLTINIVDDEPIARNDTDAVAEEATSTDGNVLSGVGTTSGAAGKDSPGADGFSGETNNGIDGVTGIHAGATGAFQAVAQDGTGKVVSGVFGTLTIHNDGSYTYVLNEDVGDGGTDVFTYQVTDGDGDNGTATLTITVPGNPNEPPIARGSSTNVSEEGLVGGLPDSNGTPDTTDLATVPGSIFVSDPDGDPLTVTLGTPAGSFFSQGNPINWTVINGGQTLIGYTGGDPTSNQVIEVTILNDGTYTVKLLDQFDHPDATIEDGLSFTIPVTVSDGEFNTPTTIVVTVEDDSPEPRNNEGSVRGIVDEDNLPTGNNDVQPGDDDPGNADGDNDGTTTGGGAGSLAALFNVGADEPMKFGLKQDTSGLPALTSKGFTVLYDVNPAGTVLTAYADVDGSGTINAGDTTVFTLTVNANGSWVFDLADQLDHPTAGTEDNIPIDFSSILSATDFDNDPATVPPNSFVVTVDDDLPAQTVQTVTANVDEDELTGGISDGDLETATASGSLAALANVGADEPGTFTFDLTGVTLPALTSHGAAVSYAVVGGMLVAYTGANIPANYVFTVSLTSGGAYQVNLLKPIDHLPNTPANDDGQDIGVDLSGAVVVTDKDGDAVRLDNGSFVVRIEDDIPVSFTPVDLTDDDGSTATTQDDALVNDGTANVTRLINDANNDGTGENFIGADGFGSLTFTSTGHTNGELLRDTGGTALTSGGKAVYLAGFGTGTLTAYQESGANAGYQAGEDTVVVFTATLNPGAGFGSNSTYTLDFNLPIDNGAGVTFDDVTATKAGNVDTYGIGADEAATQVDAILSATKANGSQGTINTNSTSIGVGNQSFNPGDALRIDFVETMTTDATKDAGFNYGDHVLTSGFEQKVPQVVGNPTAVSFKVWALNTSDTADDFPDSNPAGGFTNSSTVFITEVWVVGHTAGEPEIAPVNISGLEVGATQALAYGMSVTRNADGSVTFSGVEMNDSYGVGTGANQFDSVVVQDVTGKFDLGIFALSTVDLGDPLDLSFGVTAQDADGDTSTGTIDVTLVPESSSSSSLSLLSANDNQEQQRTANTMILAGALAAAGLATEPLAASPQDHKADSQEDHGPKANDSSSLTVDAKSVDESNATNLLDQPVAKDAGQAANDAGKSNDDAAADDKGVSNENAPAPAVSELSQGTDAPTQSEAQTSQPMMADAVAMPSAEQLAAAESKSVDGDDGKANVGKVMADALNGGEHGNLDALINAVSGHDNSGQAANDALASHGGSAVSNGDMGVLAGLAAAQSDDIMTQMTMHQDAAPAAA